MACLWAALAWALLCGLHAASGAMVQWNTTGEYVNYPYSSPYPPIMLRTVEGDAPDRVVVVTGRSSAGWQLSALQADTGAVNWSITLAPPSGSNSDLLAVSNGLPASALSDNQLNLIFMQLGTYVVALDANSGVKQWQHATYNGSTPKITGYSNSAGGRVYLTSSFRITERAVPATIHHIEALDAATGRLLWSNTTAPPPVSGLPISDTAALFGVTATPDMALYAQGTRLYSLSAKDGSQLWVAVVSAGTSTGLAANVSSIAYLAASTERPYPLLLLTSSTWDQTRFMGYRLNDTAPAMPPTAAWQMNGGQNFEGSLNEGLARLGISVPAVSELDAAFVTWSNRTSYDLANGGKPVYNTYLVGRSTTTGQELWKVNASAAGLGMLPVSPPVANRGVVSVVTSTHLAMLDADSGNSRLVWGQGPVEPLATGGQYSYVPTSTFANNWGQLVVVRCMGLEQPGSICVYNPYDGPAQQSGQQAQRPAALAAMAAAAAAALAVSWLAL